MSKKRRNTVVHVRVAIDVTNHNEVPYAFAVWMYDDVEIIRVTHKQPIAGSWWKACEVVYGWMYDCIQAYKREELFLPDQGDVLIEYGPRQ
jgi:hypothetical protein